MKKISFTKMSGAGNDFVVIDNRGGGLPDKPALARRLCDRHWGIGADGLLVLEKSESADYRMEYYNADGSHGGMCGNGGRCIAAYAFKRNIAERLHSFEALNFRYKAVVSEEVVTLTMKDPKDLRIGMMLPLSSGEMRLHFVNTGAPHAVVVIGDGNKLNSETMDVQGVGREIREHPYFRPSGTNVNFVEAAGQSLLRIRTYERGVEAETLACGTGSIASAVVAAALGRVRGSVDVHVRSGSVLRVDFEVGEEKGEFRNIRLTGPAVEVFEGRFVV
ncbi:MAG: diaminopimelate epimerase [Ignavibacteriales bacterium]|nr:diaminopimelate epimerase [Ignavibacteriales bacterium]